MVESHRGRCSASRVSPVKVTQGCSVLTTLRTVVPGRSA
uniref:Uncharacterized protein n=1 Tax=Anguilla anguilla TaxID=7936 RepID=A0A0E9W5T2_ANGAN